MTEAKGILECGEGAGEDGGIPEWAVREIARLNAALRYEQHRLDRVGMHGPGCHNWGPQHYECALAQVRRWRTRATIALKEGQPANDDTADWSQREG